MSGGPMRIAIVTCDGFNEIDSFVASYILNRLEAPGWKAEITCPSPEVVSRNGVRVTAQQPLEFASDADVVLFGSGTRSVELSRDPAVMSRLRLDPARQAIGSQCSGALFLHALGLLDGMPVCTDMFTRPIVDHVMKNYDGVLKIDGEVGSKKAYDPRTYLKPARSNMAERVKQACIDLKSDGKTMGR